MRRWILANKLILASAGAGKSQLLIDESIARAKDGQKVLIVTYTQNNQRELMERLSQLAGSAIENINVKGWFSFLLEDIIRPYQTVLFKKRISNVLLSTNDPHRRGAFTFPGTAEKRGGQFNRRHFITSKGDKAHTHYLAKLAVRICEESGASLKLGRKTIKIGLPTLRLEEIYDAVFVDEVQDLVGWDYEVLRLLTASGNIDFNCVGDFRQTIYETSNAGKDPSNNDQKLKCFEEFGFTLEHLNISRRCVQSVCDFADLIHKDGLPQTISHVDEVPEHIAHHVGVFAVRYKDAEKYIEAYSPIILRNSIGALPELCKKASAHNFGRSKGLGFDRTLIISTEGHRRFVAADKKAFLGGETDKARNRFYVAVTRARYSVAILTDDDVELDGITIWQAEPEL